MMDLCLIGELWIRVVSWKTEIAVWNSCSGSGQFIEHSACHLSGPDVSERNTRKRRQTARRLSNRKPINEVGA